MGGLIDFIFDPGGDAADAAEDAAEIQAQWQNRALDYLMEREEIPAGLRDEALMTLGGFYGLTGSGGYQPGQTGGDGAYGPAPEPGVAPQSTMDRYIELQKLIANANFKNEHMSEKTRDNHGEINTSAWERELDQIQRENPTVVFPPAPRLDPRYGGYGSPYGLTDPIWEEIDYSQYYGQLPDEGDGQFADTSIDAGFGDGAIGGEAGGADDSGFGEMQAFIDRAMASPLYQQIMGGQELGEEAIMRNAAATGGLRSGNVQGNMYDYITQLQNQALLSSYNEQLQGLLGMAGLPTNAGAIAQQMGNIGTTLGQGQVAAAQAQQQGWNNWMNTGLGIGGLIMASDIRLKKNIHKIGTVNGFNFYAWDWNSRANEKWEISRSWWYRERNCC